MIGKGKNLLLRGCHSPYGEKRFYEVLPFHITVLGAQLSGAGHRCYTA